MRRSLALPALAGLLVACGSGGDPAADTAARVLAELSAAKPTVICENGDSGRGLDNRVPWHTTYLSVPVPADSRNPADDLDRAVTAAAAAAGYPLTPDQRRPPDDLDTGTGLDAPTGPGARVLVGHRDGSELRVSIVDDEGDIVLRCAGDRWGDITTASVDRAVVVREVQFPER
jgi:hypothetical protein